MYTLNLKNVDENAAVQLKEELRKVAGEDVMLFQGKGFNGLEELTLLLPVIAPSLIEVTGNIIINWMNRNQNQNRRVEIDIDGNIIIDNYNAEDVIRILESRKK
ncbi:hypothetical protein R4Z09_26195 [Niallia oryzisoli]|uniref:Uncharacterized protein n=1 Tax=Niallia oryzisoli TaxID=1737571 RepID=A0ABZ2CAD3_9BACI